MTDREQIINFLLQSGDRKDAMIADLQKKVAVLEKQLAGNSVPVVPPSGE